MLAAGVLIAGKYRVSKKLGEGAMGSVWLAKNEVTDREFAIKVLLPEAAEAPTALARFLREARICGTLRHPSILEIYDAGAAPELGGAPFLVMERLDGASLDAVLKRRGAFAPRLAIDVVAQISRGLALAHAKGIVHRDIKPANVFLHRPGSGALEPKVLDFGISKVTGAKAPEIALTHTSALLGSPIYMSPEQMASGPELDARSDIHALGVLLWELLTGKPPFASTSYNLLVVEVMKGPRPKLRDLMPSASAGLAAIVERAFAIEPSERFQSAAKLADALDGELAPLGGGVLAARTAATEFLGEHDHGSTPPPPVLGSTTVPLSRGAPRTSRTSFADTEVAVSSGGTPVAPPAGAVSTAHEAQPEKKGAPLVRVVVAVALALAATLALMTALRRAPEPTAPLSAEPPASTPPVAAAPPPPLSSATPALAVSAPPVTPSASVTAPPPRAAAPPATAPKKPARPTPAASAPTPRPRIDQSGL